MSVPFQHSPIKAVGVRQILSLTLDRDIHHLPINRTRTYRQKNQNSVKLDLFVWPKENHIYAFSALSKVMGMKKMSKSQKFQ